MNCALVTGGSRGIGRAVCIKLATQGYHILINYKENKEAAEATLSLVREAGSDGTLMQFDVSNPGEVESVLNAWIEENKDKRIEVLVNNAGIRQDMLMFQMSNNQWSDVLDASLNGFFYVTRIIIKDMLLKRYGRIINIVSLSGLKGTAGQVNYSAAKAGVIGATKALAQEVAKRNVTVNAIAPGFISTDMTEGLPVKELSAMVPMQRFGTPEEVAEAVGFFASRGASYITGEILNINGGLYS
ncbi:MAG: 3-oxoacyl-ACP reductase FabG [Saprospiraceae bacterium]|nr:3-oxoacyl-ACP reductase FabG [Saprospiraceae bacterium]